MVCRILNVLRTNTVNVCGHDRKVYLNLVIFSCFLLYGFPKTSEISMQKTNKDLVFT